MVGRNEQQLQAISDDLNARGASDASYMIAELADSSKHEALYSVLSESDFDIALIAYGSLGSQSAGEDDASLALKELEVNFTSACSHLTYLAKYFRKRKAGKIAVITSVAGDRGRKSNYIYGSAKSGLIAFVQGLRNSLHEHGISVTDIRPGFVSSPMTEHLKQGILFVKPEAIATGIVSAIASGKDVIYVPWFWKIIMLVIRSIPERLFKRLSL